MNDNYDDDDNEADDDVDEDDDDADRIVNDNNFTVNDNDIFSINSWLRGWLPLAAYPELTGHYHWLWI